jgi:hypothetical protein
LVEKNTFYRVETKMATRLHGENSKEKTCFRVEATPPRSKRHCTTTTGTSTFTSGNLSTRTSNVKLGETATTLTPPERSTAVRRINNAIKKLDFKEVEQNLLGKNRPDLKNGVYVCDASMDDWKTYLKSERQALVSRAMEWKAGRIYIVELPKGIHEDFNDAFKVAMSRATGTFDDHLVHHGATYVDSLRHIEPDTGFGPEHGIGATRPNGMDWDEYHTLKLEVGVSRGWDKLDPKAIEWSRFPGVEYILCVYLSPELDVRQYKLHSVVNGAIVQPQMVATNIINPTNIVFDSRRLLGFPPNIPLPAGFAQPNLTIDIFPLVQRIIARRNASRQNN